MSNDKLSSWSIRVTSTEATGIESMSGLLNYTVAFGSRGRAGSGYTQNEVVLLCIRHALRNKDLLNLIHTRVASKTDVTRLYMGNDSIFSILGMNVDALFFEPSARSFKIDRETEQGLIKLIEEWNVNNKSDLLRIILASVLSSIDDVIMLLLRSFSTHILLNTSVSFFQGKISGDETKAYVLRNERPKISFTEYEINSMEKLRKNYQNLNTFKKYRDVIKEKTSGFVNEQKAVSQIFANLGNVDPKSYFPYSINDLLLPSFFQDFSIWFSLTLTTLSLIYILSSAQNSEKPPRISTILDFFAISKIRDNGPQDDVSPIYESFIHPHLMMEMDKLIKLLR